MATRAAAPPGARGCALDRSPEKCCRGRRNPGNLVRRLPIEVEIVLGFRPPVSLHAKPPQLRSAQCPAEPRRALRWIRSQRQNYAACESSPYSRSLAGQDENRVASDDGLPAIPRLFRRECQPPHPRIRSFGLDEELHTTLRRVPLADADRKQTHGPAVLRQRRPLQSRCPTVGARSTAARLDSSPNFCCPMADGAAAKVARRATCHGALHRRRASSTVRVYRSRAVTW